MSPLQPAVQTARRSLLAIVPSMGLGGAERQASLLLRALARKGWEVTLIALDSRGPFFDEVEAAGISVHFLDVRRRDFVRSAVRLSQSIRALDPDVLLLRGFSAAVLGRVAAVLARRRALVVVAEHSTGRQAGRMWWHDVVERALVPFTDVFIGVAQGQVDYLVEEKGIPRDRLTIIRNGIDYEPYLHGDRTDARLLLGISSTAYVVGIVAALRPEKDHATFLRAARIMADAHPDSRFVIVGDGPEREAVQEMVGRLSLEAQVCLLGARTDVQSLLPAFDVFCLCSKTVETFPMSVLEAMGSTLPVVATSVGGLPEMVDDGETGFLVKPGDPAALARAWTTVCEDSDLASQLGQAGWAKAHARFSDTKMAEEHVSLFEHLIECTDRSG